MRFTKSYALAALSVSVLAAPQVTVTSFSTTTIPAPTVAPKAVPPPVAPPVVSPIPPKAAPPPVVAPPVVSPAPPRPVNSAPSVASPVLPTVITSFTIAPLPSTTASVPGASAGFNGYLPKVSGLPRPSGGLLAGLRPTSLPKAAPSPKTPAGPSILCGTSQSSCPSGQYCYDANQDKVVTASDANALGTCYGGACGASTSCPVGQVCMEGMCLNQNLDCGFLGDACPEGPGWRCVGAGLFERGRGYCGYSPKFVSF